MIYARAPAEMKVVLLELLFLVSSVTSVNISLTSGELCEGAVVSWTCSAVGSLGWRNLGETRFSSVVSSTLVSLGSPSPFSSRLTCITGVMFTSVATANLTSASLNGSILECSNGNFDSSFTTISSVELNLKESVNISFLIVQFISMNEVMLRWGGAQCVSYYIVEANNITVNTTTETSYIYELDPDEIVYIFTIHGVSYTGRIFTSISEPFYLTRPQYNVSHVVDDNRTAIYVVIESDNPDQLPITSCHVRFNSEITSDCSKADLVIKYDDVIPGESYDYSVEIDNKVGSLVYNDTVNVTMDPSPSVLPSTIVERQPELPDWALPVIIVLAILLIVAVLIKLVLLYIIWKLWSSQDKNNKRVATTENLRTKSPNEKETASL